MQPAVGLDDHEAAAEIARGFADAWARPDVERFLALLAPDVRLLQPVTPPIVEREAYFDSLRLVLAIVTRPSAWPGYLRYRGYLA